MASGRIRSVPAPTSPAAPVTFPVAGTAGLGAGGAVAGTIGDSGGDGGATGEAGGRSTSFVVAATGCGTVIRAGSIARYPRRARTRTPGRLMRTCTCRNLPSQFVLVGWKPST